MRRLAAFLLFTALVVAGAVWLADRPGEVVIRWQGWRLDTSVPVLLATQLLLLAVLWAVFRILGAILGAPGRVLAARRVSRTRKGYAALSDGLAAVASGDSRRAARLARRADRLLNDASVTGLLSVQAARLSGDAGQLRTQSLAMTERPETACLGHKDLMEMALAEGDGAAALDHAGKAFALQPAAEGLAVTLFGLQLAGGHLAEAEHTLVAARRHGALAGAALDHRRALVLFARAEAAERDGDAGHALTLALEARDRDPRFVPAVALAARLFAARAKERKAISLVLSAFQVAPHPLLVGAWAALGPKEPLERVKHMQRLAEANPASPDGHVALAEAALAARLWGQARTHLEQAHAQRPSLKVLALLARLERDEKKDETAALAWLDKASQAQSDPDWACGACGHHAADFSLCCPRCGAVGRLEWTA